jgi:small multidrug resistance pump
MTGTFVLLLAAASAIFIAAASATRAYISSDNWLWVALSLTLYVIGNLVMIRIMREGGLGLAISISAIAQLILVNIIAFAIFNERLTNIQMAGVGLGVIAMVLMMWPQKPAG